MAVKATTHASMLRPIEPNSDIATGEIEFKSAQGFLSPQGSGTAESRKLPGVFNRRHMSS